MPQQISVVNGVVTVTEVGPPGTPGRDGVASATGAATLDDDRVIHVPIDAVPEVGSARTLGTGSQQAAPGDSIPEGLKTAFPSFADNDVYLAVPNRTGTIIEGGVIRRASGLIIAQTYEQLVNPTDEAIGNALLHKMNVDIKGDTAWPGPAFTTGAFGPKAMIHTEGEIRYWAPQNSIFAFGPIGFGDQIHIKNNPGSDTTIRPAWSFMSTRAYSADDGTVIFDNNDMGPNNAAFIDNPLIITQNGGYIDGFSNDNVLTSFMSQPAMLGEVHYYARYGLFFMDAYMPASSPPVDPQNASIGTQVGAYIEHLTKADRNIGISNGSAHVNRPQTSTLSGVGSTIRIDAAFVVLNNTSGNTLVLTSIPTIDDGVDGQEITLINASAKAITIQDEVSLPGSNVNTRVDLGPGDTAELIFQNSRWSRKASGPTWVRHRFSSEAGALLYPAPTVAGFTFTRTLNAVDGGGNYLDAVGTTGEAKHYSGFRCFYPGEAQARAAIIESGVFLTDGTGTGAVLMPRLGVGLVGVVDAVSYLLGSTVPQSLHSGHSMGVNAQTGTSYSVLDADRGRSVVRNNASASTQTWPHDAASGATNLPIGTIIYTFNRGAGAITHQNNGTSTVLVTGTQGQNTWWKAQKISANTWAIGPG